jgi:hypothetical protein
MLLQTILRRTAVASKIFRQTDRFYRGTVPTRKSKKINLVSKALENMIRAYYSLKFSSFCCFYWTMGDFTADRLSIPNFLKRLPGYVAYAELFFNSYWLGTMQLYFCVTCWFLIIYRYFILFDHWWYIEMLFYKIFLFVKKKIPYLSCFWWWRRAMQRSAESTFFAHISAKSKWNLKIF